MTTTTIEIAKDYLHFGAAHFTIFSATERERIHGHNFYVVALVNSEVGEDGLAFDYNVVKRELKTLCDSLDEYMLLPTESPHLNIEQRANAVIAHFADEALQFPPQDVLLLPVRNITVEELAQWFLDKLLATPAISALAISELVIKVSSGPGQWAIASWSES